MERQVHFLVRLVDDLLEISRITRGVIDVTMQPLDLGAIVHRGDRKQPTLRGERPAPADVQRSGGPARLSRATRSG